MIIVSQESPSAGFIADLTLTTVNPGARPQIVTGLEFRLELSFVDEPKTETLKGEEKLDTYIVTHAVESLEQLTESVLTLSILN